MNKEEKDEIKQNINIHKMNIQTQQKHIDELHQEIEHFRNKVRANQRIVELLEKGLKDE